MHKTRKVVIIGAGHVGSHVALALVQSGDVDDIVLIDKDENKALGQACDLDDAVTGAACGRDTVVRAGDYTELNNADILVTAFGRSRRPGETRLDMFTDSIRMADDVVAHLRQVDFHGIMISISNPADIICEYIRRRMAWAPQRCFCTGTSLESCRLLRVMGNLAGYARRSLQGYCLGEHGNSGFIAWSTVRINGRLFTEIMKEKPEWGDLDLADLQLKVKRAGDMEVDFKGCTEFGIANATLMIIRAVLHDQNLIWPCSTVLDGKYGEKDGVAGVPCVIGRNGIEEVVEIPLSPEEQEKFHASCDIIRGFLQRAEEIG